MRRRKTRADHFEAACAAASDLNILYAVIALLEGGTIQTNVADAAKEAIIRRCRQGGLLLEAHDRHRFAALSEKGKA